MQADLHVFLYCHLREQADILIGAADAHFTYFIRPFFEYTLPVKQDVSLRWSDAAGHSVEHGGLARAVWADQAKQLSLPN